MSVFGTLAQYQGAAAGVYANADSPVSGGTIAPGSITNVQIANQTILATNIANNTITAAQIAPGTITNTQIANNTITAAKLAPGVDGSVLYYDGASASWKVDNASKCCMGTDTYNNSQANCVTIGEGAVTLANDCIAVGNAAGATTSGAIAIGNGTNAAAANAVVFGPGASSTIVDSVAFGSNATANDAAHSVGFGCAAASTSVGLFGVTLNSDSRQIETHSVHYAADATVGVINLTATAPRIVRYTNATQVNLPDTTTVTNGFCIKIFAGTAGSLPVHISTGAGLVVTINAGASAEVTCVNNAANVAASWAVTSFTSAAVPAVTPPSVPAGVDIVTCALTANQTAAANNSTITWNTVAYSGPGNSIVETVPGNGIFVVLIPGVYQFTFQATGVGAGVSTYLRFVGGPDYVNVALDAGVSASFTIVRRMGINNLVQANITNAGQTLYAPVTPGQELTFLNIVRLS